MHHDEKCPCGGYAFQVPCLCKEHGDGEEQPCPRHEWGAFVIYHGNTQHALHVLGARRRLRPCPFCGGEAKLEKAQRNLVDWVDGTPVARGEETSLCVKCGKCGATTKTVVIPYHPIGDMVQVADYETEAIVLWNRRS